MQIEDKISLIKYSKYNYDSRWNKYHTKEETNEIFDLDFSRELLKDSTFSNGIWNLLSYFDFSGIFSDYGSKLTELQKNLMEMFVIRKVFNVDSLFEKMPFNLKFEFLMQLYDRFGKTRDCYFSYIMRAMKTDEERIKLFNAIVDKTSDAELRFMIRESYQDAKDSFLKIICQNERVANIIIDTVSAPIFYEMVDTLGLSENYLIKRKNDLCEVINNYQEYDVKDVKYAFCELHFHETINNTINNIRTLIEFADTDVEFKEKLGEAYDIFNNLMAFFSNENEYREEDISILNMPMKLNCDFIDKCLLLAKLSFKETISQEIKKDVYKNIEPKKMRSSDGKEVLMYTIENQTEDQKKVPMLISTIGLPIDTTGKDYKEAYYSQKNNELVYQRRCFSLIDERKLRGLFGTNKRVCFGYEDLSGRELVYATTCDSRSDGNGYRFRRERLICKNTFLPFDKFVEKIYGHSEVLLKMTNTKEPIKPSYVLVHTEEPTQFEIDVAAEFGIPIRYVNIEKYEQLPNTKYENADYYYEFSKTKIEKKEKVILK